MPPFALDYIRNEVVDAARAYNADAQESDRIRSVALFGSYADGNATADSDVDLLVSFHSPAVSLFALARVLDEMESRIGVDVDVVQDPVPDDSLLLISKVVPLYAE